MLQRGEIRKKNLGMDPKQVLWILVVDILLFGSMLCPSGLSTTSWQSHRSKTEKETAPSCGPVPFAPMVATPLISASPSALFFHYMFAAIWLYGSIPHLHILLRNLNKTPNLIAYKFYSLQSTRTQIIQVIYNKPYLSLCL